MATKKGYARLSLGTLQGTRRTLARVCRLLFNGELDMEPGESRLLVDGLKALIAAHKAEADLGVADRLDAIEQRLSGANR